MKKSVYFAGKINNKKLGDYCPDWRNEILGGDNHQVDSMDKSSNNPYFEYAGPQYYREHGMIYTGKLDHKDTYFNNIGNIQDCDIVFAYFDSNDAYGTMAEIGFAHGLGKKIFLCYTANVDKQELWFVFSFADTIIQVKDHKAGWKIFEKDILGKYDYKEYLKTDYWKELSKECKDEAVNKCKLCNSSNLLNVHHRSYENLGKRDLEKKDLIVLCNSCHKKYHSQ